MTGSTMAPDVVPPTAFDSEQALLGAILHNNDALDRARDHVQPGDFFEPLHRHIFEVMMSIGVEKGPGIGVQKGPIFDPIIPVGDAAGDAAKPSG